MIIKENILKEYTEIIECFDICVVEIIDVEIIDVKIFYDYKYVYKNITYKQHDSCINIQDYNKLLVKDRLKKLETL